MNLKKLTVIVLLLLLFFIGSVNAANETDIISNDDTMEQTLSISDENENLEENAVEFKGTTFTDLQDNISSCSDGDVINLKNDVKQDGDTFITINKSVTINGNGYTIDADGKSRIFYISSCNEVFLNNITFINGNDSYGGAIYVNEVNVTVLDCKFINNTASEYGGAIFVYANDLLAVNSTFINNSAHGGGAINYYGTGSVSGCEFAGNRADYGGAVYGCPNLFDSKFVNNSASESGGAVYDGFGETNVSGCEFAGNRAEYGGAINYYRCKANITCCEFEKNTASISGGSICWWECNGGNLSSCNFQDNNATSGGAIYINCGNDNITVTNNTFTSNSAGISGGAVYWDYGSGEIKNCLFTENTAVKNGGAVNIECNNTSVLNCSFKMNKAANGTDICNKTAVTTGGNYYFSESYMEINDMTRGYNSGCDFQATLKDNAGKVLAGETVIFTINGKQYTATTGSNGVATLNAKIAEGTYNVIVTNTLNSNNVTANLKIVARLTGSNLNMFYRDGSELKIRVYGDDGNAAGEGETVTVNLAGVTYTLKTDKNGYASLPVTANLKKNKKAVTYTATVTYKGSTLEKTVKINPILKYKTQKIKKSKKTNKIKVSLKKALKSKKIILKIKGKKITAKTNKKGVATFKIPKKVVKKLKAGKKYKVVFTYGKSTLTKKVKVKK